MKEKVIKLIAEFAEVPESEINENTNLTKDLELDSLDLVDLIVEFEKIYGASIPDTDLKTIQTVGDILKYIDVKEE